MTRGRVGGKVVSAVAAAAAVRLLLWTPPRRVALRVADGVSRPLWFLWGRRRRAELVSQIRAALPDVDETRARRIARASFALLPRNLAEIGHPRSLGGGGRDGAPEFVGVKSSPEAEALLAGQVILVSGHFASWEVACVAVNRRLGHPVVMPVHELPLASLEREVLRNRLRCGRDVKFLTRAASGDARAGLLAALRERSSIALLADQRVRGGVAGKLLGRDVLLNDIPARLAVMSGAPVVMFRARSVDLHRYEIDLGPVFRPEDFNGDTAALTQKINDIFGQWISEAPEQWLWNRRRWRPAEE